MMGAISVTEYTDTTTADTHRSKVTVGQYIFAYMCCWRNQISRKFQQRKTSAYWEKLVARSFWSASKVRICNNIKQNRKVKSKLNKINICVAFLDFYYVRCHDRHRQLLYYARLS